MFPLLLIKEGQVPATSRQMWSCLQFTPGIACKHHQTYRKDLPSSQLHFYLTMTVAFDNALVSHDKVGYTVQREISDEVERGLIAAAPAE